MLSKIFGLVLISTTCIAFNDQESITSFRIRVNTNDETLLVIRSPQLAKHLTREMDRLWDTADLRITPHIQRKLDRQQIRCGDGVERG